MSGSPEGRAPLLSDAYDSLDDAGRAAYERMASVRSHAEGSPHLGAVYGCMFHAPTLAPLVGDLGEHLRFGGSLPDDVREVCILRWAARRGYGYEWAHHLRPAAQAGIDDATVDALRGDGVPDGLRADQAAAVRAVDAVAADRELPRDLFDELVGSFGQEGAVELVVLCGLYGMMGAMVTAFGITPELDGLPPAPF